ncbi:MAG: SDR family oxidoreductase [Planctomycetes bacterium]|nr:SDR family oxidoreductase [Planctomycetota bacterium]
MSDPTVQQLFDLTGRVALITGASGYLGRAMAGALAEAGARVVVGSRDAQKARETAASLPCPDQEHLGVALDYLDADSLGTGFADAIDEAGQIDILVNNGNHPVGKDWTNVSADEFNQQLQTATGYFELSRLLRDHVVQRQATGAIVMIGSMYGVVGSYPYVYEGVSPISPVSYHALKGGIVHMTRHLAVAWADHGVRVNCLSPGPFPKPEAPAELVERLKTKSPLGRMGLPHELKGALLLMVSDAGSYLTGQNLLIDGGWTAW